MPSRLPELEQVVRDFDLLAVYLFGSRAEDGLARLEGRPVGSGGSDLDLGVVFRDFELPVARLGALQVALEEIFAPLRIDLVPLQHLDALFQFQAIDGHRVTASDALAADYYELEVMRRAADLLPIERRLEKEEFGVTTA